MNLLEIRIGTPHRSGGIVIRKWYILTEWNGFYETELRDIDSPQYSVSVWKYKMHGCYTGRVYKIWRPADGGFNGVYDESVLDSIDNGSIMKHIKIDCKLHAADVELALMKSSDQLRAKGLLEMLPT